MSTIIISKGGKTIDSREGWWFGININRITYKTVEDRFDIEVFARKKSVNTDGSIDTTDEVVIVRYNRSPNIPTRIARLDEAYNVLQSILNAIDTGQNVWDARDLK